MSEPTKSATVIPEGGPQGTRLESAAPAPVAPPTPERSIDDINKEILGLDRVLDRDKRDALMAERDALTRKQLGEEPKEEQIEQQMPPEIASALERVVDPTIRAEIQGEIVKLDALAEAAGIGGEEFSRVAGYA